MAGRISRHILQSNSTSIVASRFSNQMEVYKFQKATHLCITANRTQLLHSQQQQSQNRIGRISSHRSNLSFHFMKYLLGDDSNHMRQTWSFQTLEVEANVQTCRTRCILVPYHQSHGQGWRCLPPHDSPQLSKWHNGTSHDNSSWIAKLVCNDLALRVDWLINLINIAHLQASCFGIGIGKVTIGVEDDQLNSCLFDQFHTKAIASTTSFHNQLVQYRPQKRNAR